MLWRPLCLISCCSVFAGERIGLLFLPLWLWQWTTEESSVSQNVVSQATSTSNWKNSLHGMREFIYLQINIKLLFSIISKACLYFQRISKGLWTAGMYFMQNVATHMGRRMLVALPSNGSIGSFPTAFLFHLVYTERFREATHCNRA